MAGAASNQLRSAFVAEVTPGTTPATPAFKTMHTPALFDAGVERFHQTSLTAGGAVMGDARLTAPAGGKITDAPLVYGLYDPLFESLLQSSFSTNAMMDGKARSCMTFENAIPQGIGGTVALMRYLGVEATGAMIKADARGKVTVSFDLMGMESKDATTTAISGATYTDPTNYDPFSAAADLGTITYGGLTLDGIAGMEINLAYDGRDIQPVLGGDVLAGITRGALKPTIKLKCYVDTNFLSAYNLARQATQSAGYVLTINLGSVTNKKYRLTFSNVYLDGAPPDFSGNTAFVTLSLAAGYSTVVSGVCGMTRALS